MVAKRREINREKLGFGELVVNLEFSFYTVNSGKEVYIT